MARLARLRHLRHGEFARVRRRGKVLDWLGALVTTLTGTGATNTFTATNATDLFTSTAHGLVTGEHPVMVSNAGGALPTGLSASTIYWPIYVSANTFRLATSRDAARSNVYVAISDDGTGTQSWYRPAEANLDVHSWTKVARAEQLDAASDIDSVVATK